MNKDQQYSGCRNTEHAHLGDHDRMAFCTPHIPGLVPTTLVTLKDATHLVTFEPFAGFPYCPVPRYPDTPELDRQIALRKSGKAGVVQEFIDWLLDEKGYEIVTGYEEGEPYSLYSREGLMEQFFDIDPAKIDKERRAVLRWVRSQNG